MGCGIGMIKYLLFIFNFIFAVCGLGILAYCVVIHLHLVDIPQDLNTNLAFPLITLIVIGTIIFVTSFFGCCGAIRESHCMTITFASCLLFILLVQVAVAVYAFVVVKDTDNHVTIAEKYREIFNDYEKEKNRKFVDMVQSSLNCCGITSASDYGNRPIPGSCCQKLSTDTCDLANASPKGCEQAIKNLLGNLGTVFGAVAIGVASVELIGIIFALCLANSIRNAERRGYRV